MIHKLRFLVLLEFGLTKYPLKLEVLLIYKSPSSPVKSEIPSVKVVFLDSHPLRLWHTIHWRNKWWSSLCAFGARHLRPFGNAFGIGSLDIPGKILESEPLVAHGRSTMATTCWAMPMVEDVMIYLQPKLPASNWRRSEWVGEKHSWHVLSVKKRSTSWKLRI